MKRFALLGVATAAMLVPSSATAASVNYSGATSADPAATVAFTIKSKNGKKKIANPSYTNVRAQCHDTDGANPQEILLGGNGRGAAVVTRKKRFRWQATEPFVSTMRFYGKLKSGGRAAGTLEYFGEVETASGTQYCETGVVNWAARTG